MTRPEVTVTVEVPDPAATAPQPGTVGPRPGAGPLPGAPGAPGVEAPGVPSVAAPGPAAPAGPLARTGLDAGGLLLLAAALVCLGALLLRRARTQALARNRPSRHVELPMTASRRVTSLVALISVFLLGLSGLVLAQSATESTTVSTSTTMPERTLDLLDLVGQPLESVALRGGLATPFQVRVTDSDIDLLGEDAPFRVQSSMNNLYLVTGADGGGNPVVDTAGDDVIPSAKIDLGYATDPLGARDVIVDVDLRYVVGATTAITCADVAAILGLSEVDQLLDPICSLLTTLTGEALTVGDVPVSPATTLVDQLLDEALAMADLPMRITNPDSGPFTQANCASGLGAADARCAGQAGTARTVLQGSPNATQALLDLLQDLADDVIVLVGPPEAAATVNEVIQALRDAGGDAQLLGDSLADSAYSEADRVALINGLLDAMAPADLGLGDLVLSGQYRSLPTLTVDTSEVVNGGEYAGTLTVTLLEGSLE